ANAFYDGLQHLFVIRIFSVLNPFADQITSDTAEIFMTEIGKETAGIGQHSNKLTQNTYIRHRTHLSSHAINMIIEPPCGTQLNLTRDAAALEAATHSHQRIIVIRIQAVQNGLWQLIILGASIQKTCQSLGQMYIQNRV